MEDNGEMGGVRKRSSWAPLPSPIATAKGVRSAADPIFEEYVDKSTHIPELTLPEHVNLFKDIDYQALVARDGRSVKRLLRSALEFGVFRISGLGISPEEVRSVLSEAYGIFPEEHLPDYDGRQELVWRPSDKEVAVRAERALGAERYRSFSQQLDNVASKLEAIAEEVAQIISESATEVSQKKIQQRESTLSLNRYRHHTLMDQNPTPSNRKTQESCEYALSLHLLMEQFGFSIQSARGHLSFNTRPGTLVVVVGKLLENWSLGRFKSASEEPTFEPTLHERSASFSVKLKCSPPSLCRCHDNIVKKFSISDQIATMLILLFLYKLLVFLYF